MLKLYRVKNIGRIDGGGYNECVVVAENKEQASSIASKKYWMYDKNKIILTEIEFDKPRAILGNWVESKYDDN